MEIVQLGINHRTAPLKVRECLSLSKVKKKKISSKLEKNKFCSEFFFLDTCNRVEFYILTEEKNKAEKFILNIMEEYSGVSREKLNSYLCTNYDFSAVYHFYKVGAGLDSLVIGESQILNQIKEEYELAKDLDIIDSYFNQLFLETIRVAKKVRSKTTINQRAVSVSYAAVELARDIFGSLAGEKVMILGAGETSELVLKNLVNYGVKGVLVANRTYENGKKLAEKYNGEVIHWEDLRNYINKVDIIIASTAAPHLVLNKESDKKVLKKKRGPMFLIDIAVPRDINPEFHKISGIHLYNIDDLKEIVEENMKIKKKEENKEKKILNDKVEEYKNWVKERRCVPIIKKMRKEAQKIKEKEVDRAIHLLNESEDSPEEIIDNLAHRLVNKLLHKPTVGIKEIAVNKDKKEDIELVKKVFTANS